MDDGPDGLTAHEILRDLRFIKLSPNDRRRSALLLNEFKTRNLSYAEEKELRGIHRRHSVAIADLREMEQNARVGLAKEARGHTLIEQKLQEASTVGAQRQRDDLARLTSEIDGLEKEERDFGI